MNSRQTYERILDHVLKVFLILLAVTMISMVTATGAVRLFATFACAGYILCMLVVSWSVSRLRKQDLIDESRKRFEEGRSKDVNNQHGSNHHPPADGDAVEIPPAVPTDK